MKANTENQAVKIVKRDKETGKLSLVTHTIFNPSCKVQAINNQLKGKTVTNYVGKETASVSQCSIINDLLVQGKTIREIAGRMIEVKAFPAMHEGHKTSLLQDDNAILKACITRVKRHVVASKERALSGKLTDEKLIEALYTVEAK